MNVSVLLDSRPRYSWYSWAVNPGRCRWWSLCSSVFPGTQSWTLQVEVSELLDTPGYSVPDLAGEGLGTPRYSAPILLVVFGPPGYSAPDLPGEGLGTPLYSPPILSVILGTPCRTLQVEVWVLLGAPGYSVLDLAGGGFDTP